MINLVENIAKHWYLGYVAIPLVGIYEFINNWLISHKGEHSNEN